MFDVTPPQKITVKHLVCYEKLQPDEIIYYLKSHRFVIVPSDQVQRQAIQHTNSIGHNVQSQLLTKPIDKHL